jgi:hypothetical protein
LTNEDVSGVDFFDVTDERRIRIDGLDLLVRYIILEYQGERRVKLHAYADLP